MLKSNMLWPGLAAVVLACMLRGVGAQSNETKAVCTDSSFTWSYNSLKQDPCEIATQLGSVCSENSFLIQPLSVGFVYQGPTLENANQCRCSSVFYSLVSACAACQDRNWIGWTKYKTNCSTIYSTVFPGSLPPGTLVPNYAYDNVSAQGTFNVTIAQFDSSGPESSGAASSTSSPTPTPSTGSGKKSNAGAIAGGVIGGVVFIALIAGLIIWLLRRRHNNRIAPSQAYGAGQMAPVSFNTTGSYLPPSTPKLYNPSDPSTFPSSFSTPPNNSQSSPYMNPSITGSTQPTVNHSARYTGAPEL
ncbi:hypothetical protein BDQ17DRAFT_1404376 [Cyathus striatus]|nr:hypothetical protein BDQ17DRAFT_1404376 [Cyathus striatus]